MCLLPSRLEPGVVGAAEEEEEDSSADAAVQLVLAVVGGRLRGAVAVAESSPQPCPAMPETLHLDVEICPPKLARFLDFWKCR